MVQGWHNGTFPNQGLALIHPATDNNARAFSSSEATTVANRPRLVIDFTLPTSTPTNTHTPTNTPTGTLTPSATPTSTLPPTPIPTTTLSSFGGRFFHDQNGNGAYDAGEPGFANILIYLVRDTLLVGTATSDSNGLFQFTGLARATYRVHLQAATIPLRFEINPISMYHYLDNGTAGYLSLRSAAPVRWDIPFIPQPPPPEPPAITLNLQPERVEFVQINTDPSNPLGAGKSTLVRVYVQAFGASSPIANIGGRLARGDAIGDENLWVTGIESVNTITVDPAVSPYIPDAPLQRTLNFLLPAEWTAQGTRGFTVWVNDDYGPHLRECLGCRADNKEVVVRTFERFKPLNMMFFRVDAVDGQLPSREEILRSVRVVKQLYPIDRVRLWNHGVFVAHFNWAAEGSGLKVCGDWSELIWRFRLINAWEFDPADDMFWHGFLDDTVSSPYDGCGFTDSRESASQVSATGRGGGFAAAHELGHNQGWQHVACAAASGGTDPGYPLASGLLDWSGIDLPGLNFLNRAGTYDVMSYCGPQWISRYQYQRALGRFSPLLGSQNEPILSQAAPVAPSPDPNGNYLFVAGMLQNGALEQFEPSYRVTLPPGSHDEAGAGVFTMEVQDGPGNVLFTRNFTLLGHNYVGDETSGAFFEVVPFAPTARRIVIKYAGTTIATREASANIPTVQLLSPNGGENWLAGSDYQITWTAADADGEALFYTLHYSPDNGATWSTLVSNISGTTYSVNTAFLAGSAQALIRVVASDGLNTASDSSNATFTVALKPPEALILTPETNQNFPVGSLVELDGLATDIEDGPLPDTSLVWTSDQQGVIGSGTYLSTSSLLPGLHTISLTATDSDGLPASTSVTIFIGAQVYLPIVVK